MKKYLSKFYKIPTESRQKESDGHPADDSENPEGGPFCKLMEGALTLSHLLPAFFVAAIIAFTLPNTNPVLEKIPELLQLEEEAQAKVSSEAAGEEETTAPVIGKGDFTDGVYSGQGTGYGGTISVSVRVLDGSIVSVEIVEAAKETTSFLNQAKAVINEVLAAQTWEVDVVSGATYSSRGILAAIQNALTGETVIQETKKAEERQKAESLAYEEPDSYKDGEYYGSAKGFGGNITVKVTIKDGKITAVVVTGAAGETPSYLTRAKSVIDQVLKKQSPNVDCVSGATYSSNGILNAVKNALWEAAGEKVSETSGESETTKKETEKAVVVGSDEGFTDGSYRGSAQGFGGPIRVKVVIKDGKITKITVLSAEDETPSFFEKAKAVISAILEKQGTDTDVISGATYSSRGILNAVSDALNQALKKAEREESEESPEESSAGQEEEPQIERIDCPDGTYYGSGSGFGGDICLSITVKEGRISDISILSAEDETPGFFARAMAVIDHILAAQSTDVDVVSGATYSSKGIIEAVSDALSHARYSEEESSEEESAETESIREEESEKESISPKEESETLKGSFMDGSYKADARCSDDSGSYFFDYGVSVVLTVKDGRITEVKAERFDDPDDNEAYMEGAMKGRTVRGIFYEGIGSQILSRQSAADIDVVSGATYSSNAVITAAKKAILLAEGKQVPETESMPESESETEKASEQESETAGERESGEENLYADGVYEGTADCIDLDSWCFDYTLLARITVKGGKISEILVDRTEDYSPNPEDNDLYLEWALSGRSVRGVFYEGIIKQLLEKQELSKVDAVSGASYSSGSILEACRQALSKAGN